MSNVIKPPSNGTVALCSVTVMPAGGKTIEAEKETMWTKYVGFYLDRKNLSRFTIFLVSSQ